MSLPTDIENDDIYRRWRDEKLDGYPSNIDELTIEVDDPGKPSSNQITSLLEKCRKANMAIYACPKPPGEDTGEDKSIPINMGASLGLNRVDRPLTTDDDGVSELTVAADGQKSAYIPYTDRPLGWHTDGCYNDAEHLINGFILHCVRAAETGGENFLLDPEIAYILLRDEDADFIDGLMLPDALTIPANMENEKVVRAEQVGPALSINPIAGSLHLRYTGRKTYVTWLDDPRVDGALAFLQSILNSQTPYIFNVKLNPGSGLVGNNVLHGRTKFIDGEDQQHKRLIYRIYYLDRIGHS